MDRSESEPRRMGRGWANRVASARTAAGIASGVRMRASYDKYSRRIAKRNPLSSRFPHNPDVRPCARHPLTA